MDPKRVSLAGLVFGFLMIMGAGLVDRYTQTLLLCGSIILAGSLIAYAISVHTRR